MLDKDEISEKKDFFTKVRNMKTINKKLAMSRPVLLKKRSEKNAKVKAVNKKAHKKTGSRKVENRKGDPKITNGKNILSKSVMMHDKQGEPVRRIKKSNKDKKKLKKLKEILARHGKQSRTLHGKISKRDLLGTRNQKQSILGSELDILSINNSESQFADMTSTKSNHSTANNIGSHSSTQSIIIFLTLIVIFISLLVLIKFSRKKQDRISLVPTVKGQRLTGGKPTHPRILNDTNDYTPPNTMKSQIMSENKFAGGAHLVSISSSRHSSTQSQNSIRSSVSSNLSFVSSSKTLSMCSDRSELSASSAASFERKKAMQQVPPTLTKQSETLDRKATFSMLRPQGEWDKEVRTSIIGSRVDFTLNSGSVNFDGSKPLTRVVVPNRNSYQEESEEIEECQNALEDMKRF